MAQYPRILNTITRMRNFCVANGLDIVTPFNVRQYNNAVDVKYHLPTFGRKDGDCLAVLIGNTAGLWPHFIQSAYNNHDLMNQPHPFDTWITNIVNQAVDIAQPHPTAGDEIVLDGREEASTELYGLSATHVYEEFLASLDEVTRDTLLHLPEGPISMQTRLSYDLSPGYHIALQHLCHAIGLGYYDTKSFTVCHPVLGPWFALRAVIILDAPPCLPVIDHSLTDTVTEPTATTSTVSTPKHVYTAVHPYRPSVLLPARALTNTPPKDSAAHSGEAGEEQKTVSAPPQADSCYSTSRGALMRGANGMALLVPQHIDHPLATTEVPLPLQGHTVSSTGDSNGVSTTAAAVSGASAAVTPSCEGSRIYAKASPVFQGSLRTVPTPSTAAVLGATTGTAGATSAPFPTSIVGSTAYQLHVGPLPFTPCTNLGCEPAHAAALQAAIDKSSVYRPRCFAATGSEDAKENAAAAVTAASDIAPAAVSPLALALDTELFRAALHATTPPCAVPTEENASRWAHPSLRFLAVRDTCAVGEEYAYPPDMSLFHYAHDCDTVMEAVKRVEHMYRVEQ